MRGVKGFALAFDKNVCLYDDLFPLLSVGGLLLNCSFWVPAVSSFLRRLEISSMILINLSLPFSRILATPTLLSFTSFSEAKALYANIAKISKDVLSGVVAMETVE